MYFPLHPQEIRLVDISPGTWKDDVQCTLRHASVTGKPSYNALSYVWGSLSATRRSIIVTGNPRSVTVNLELALRRIRQPDDTATFWIDALSINQADIAERSTQVGMMRNIYASASAVVIYLGEPPPQGLSGCPSNNKQPLSLSKFYCDSRDGEKIAKFQDRCLPRVGQKGSGSKKKLHYPHEVCCLLSLLAQTSDLESVAPFNLDSQLSLDSFYQRNVFEALRYLMRSSWWDRIWVVQEAVVPKNIILVYDTITAPWEMFVKAAQAYTTSSLHSAISSFPREYSDVLRFFSRIVLDIHQLRCRWENEENTTLLSLLRQFSNRKASDDRDKVYALIGLVTETTDSKLPLIKPDYFLDTSDVFKNTVLRIIEMTGSLSILVGSLGQKSRQDLPSWIIDWSTASDDTNGRRVEDTENYNASAGVKVRILRDRETHLSGVSKYLKEIATELGSGGKAIHSEMSPREKYTLLLSSSEWEKSLVKSKRAEPYENECLEAIQSYLAVHGGLIWARKVGDGLEFPGLYKGKVVRAGDTNLWNSNLELLVLNWAATIADHFNADIQAKSIIPMQNVEESLLKALCADMAPPDSHDNGSKSVRITDKELEEVISWIQHLGGLSGPKGLWEKLSERHGIGGSTETPKLSPRMVEAIKRATFRRRIFITDTGFMGVGPGELQEGDALFILVGGQTPFILRESGSCKFPLITYERYSMRIKRPSFKLIGDCYVHKLMDGEGMEGWERAVSKSFDHYKAEMQMCIHDMREMDSTKRELERAREVLRVMKEPEFAAWLLQPHGTADKDSGL
ncbi:hypothetical protein ONS95_013728 [Cadophora gregata]|uniref:uncharacterized protein n=1 Tax=Cadophora gregata TaxID=51156 RepID=UPI0026DB1652|nr:uncharacterized protein ONS95_013728 [Cadophora gregata]KAK0114230.1 hypothetical protein ONS95_013728 [Cadophora gregata]